MDTEGKKNGEMKMGKHKMISNEKRLDFSGFRLQRQIEEDLSLKESAVSFFHSFHSPSYLTKPYRETLSERSHSETVETKQNAH